MASSAKSLFSKEQQKNQNSAEETVQSTTNSNAVNSNSNSKSNSTTTTTTTTTPKLNDTEQGKSLPKATTTTNNNIDNDDNNVASANVVYDVEHLATFCTTTGTCHETNNGARPTKNGFCKNKKNKFSSNNNTTSASSINNNGDDDDNNSTSIQDSFVSNGIVKANENDNVDRDFDSSSAAAAATPKVALEKLFELEKLSGVWTQRMQIVLADEFMLIIDCETNSIVEKFHRSCVTKPEAFNQYNHIYNNIVVFIIQQQLNVNVNANVDANVNVNVNEQHLSLRENQEDNSEISEKQIFRDKINGQGEIHIFQCVSHSAQKLVDDILTWKRSNIIIRTNDQKMLLNQAISNNKEANKQQQATKTDLINKQEFSTNKQESSKTTTTTTTTSSSSEAQKLDDINKRKETLAGCSSKPAITVVASSSLNTSDNVPIVNVNVKETVQVFNQIAALREKGKPTSPTINTSRPLSEPLGNSNHSSKMNNNNNLQNSSSSALANGAQLSSPQMAAPGQSYMQRSIRATLAPKYTSEAEPKVSTTNNNTNKPPYDQTSSTNLNNNNDNNNNNNKSPIITNKQSSDLNGSFSSSSEAAKSSSSSSSAQYLNSSSSSSSKQKAHNNSNNLNNGNHHHHHHHHHNKSNQHQATSRNTSSISHDVSEHQQGKLMVQETGVGANTGHSRLSHQVSSSSSSTELQQQQQQQANSHHHKGSKSSSRQQQQQQQKTQSDSSRSYASSSSQNQVDQAVAAIRELQSKRKLSKRSSQDGSINKSTNGNQQQPLTSSELALLNAKACGPNEDDYFEILSKFKLAFNLLAKLKGCIHEPNAPELVHFLFTPLAIIIESARDAIPPIDPTQVGIPYLNQDALDLLSNCCTSKESDMWISLGPNWTQTIDMSLLKASRLPSSFQPIFSDGWAPIIGELELIGLTAPTKSSDIVDSRGKDFLHQRGDRSSRHSQQAPQAFPLDHEASVSTNDHQIAFDNNRMMLAHGKPDKSARGEGQHSSKQQKRNIQQQQQSSRVSSMEQQTTSALINNDPYHRPYPIPYGYTDLASLEPSTVAGGHSSDNRIPVEVASQAVRNSRHGGAERLSSKHHIQSNRIPPDYHTNQELNPYLVQNNTVSHHQQRLPVDNCHLLSSQQYHSDDYTELHPGFPIDDQRNLRMTGPSNYPSGIPMTRDKAHYNRKNDMRHNSGLYSKQQLHNYETDYLDESEHEAMLLDLGPSQTEWFYELQSRGALIVRVLFTREANNDKELSVTRGEILEVLDDSRKWWRARNIDLQIAHVPHTIVAIMQGYQTLDELLINSNNSSSDIYNEDPNIDNHTRYLRSDNVTKQWNGRVDDKRNSKTAGAFRYF